MKKFITLLCVCALFFSCERNVPQSTFKVDLIYPTQKSVEFGEPVKIVFSISDAAPVNSVSYKAHFFENVKVTNEKGDYLYPTKWYESEVSDGKIVFYATQTEKSGDNITFRFKVDKRIEVESSFYLNQTYYKD